MPTATDSDGIVHNVRVGSGLAIPQCGTRRDIAKINTHEDAPVTCFACIGEGSLKRSREYIVCDNCGAWWVEVDEVLTYVVNSPVTDPDAGNFTVMQQGTLPTCKRCP